MRNPRKFRFGVASVPADSGRDLREAARRAEDLGYSTMFMPDHFVGIQLEPLTAITYAAAVSDKLKVGTLMLANDFRHPALVAKQAATLDMLCDGRFELGLGAGWLTADYLAVGLPHDDGRTRVARLAEAVSVIKSSWAGEAFDFHGEHYSFGGYQGLPAPRTPGGPPLFMAGGGPGMLRLAGREADIVGVNPNLRAGTFGPDILQTALAAATDKKLDWIREGAGDRFDDVELQIRYYLAGIGADGLRLAEAAATDFGATPAEVVGSTFALVGTVDEVCDRLIERRERWSLSYIVIGWEVVDAFAPVVARLAGT